MPPQKRSDLDAEKNIFMAEEKWSKVLGHIWVGCGPLPGCQSEMKG